MIIFNKIRFKNFGSFGNTMTEIVLDKNNTTLICGKNGSGKSFAFLDSITFALFGKPFRKINIPQLSNTINQKNCLVEIEFTKGSDLFLVKRGISPRLFEIYKNSELLNQDAKSLDYQELLEDQILKMNYKTFTQVVILGSSAFVPFMQLSAADRRSVIENILDINIFSTMNVVLKGKILSIKENIKELNTKLEIERNKINSHSQFIQTLENKINEDNQTKYERVKELQEKIAEIDNEYFSNNKNKIDDKLENIISKINNHKFNINKINDFIVEIKTEQNEKNKEIKFFHDNEVCPVCSQSITDSFKDEKIIINDKIIEKYQKDISDKNSILKQLKSELFDFETNMELIRSEIAKIQADTQTIEAYKKEIIHIEKGIVKDSLIENIELEKQKLTKYMGSLSTIELEKEEHSEDMLYHELANELLRDGGVKTKIIKYYLPHINKFINKYLSSMDFFVQFYLDNEFNEQIKSRHRDDFSYMNFSEGEKLRIDLSLLLAWRDIAKMKNSVHCNLLILDEVFDSSLDSVGMDELMKLLKMVSKESNVYVISHKADQLVDKFSNIITFEKKNNFSKITSK